MASKQPQPEQPFVPTKIKGIKDLRVGDVIRFNKEIVRQSMMPKYMEKEVRERLTIVTVGNSEYIRYVESPICDNLVVGRYGDESLLRKGYVVVRRVDNGFTYAYAFDKYADHPYGAIDVQIHDAKRIKNGSGPLLPKGIPHGVITETHQRQLSGFIKKISCKDDFKSIDELLSNGDWRKDWRNMASIRRHQLVNYDVYLAARMAERAIRSRLLKKAARKASFERSIKPSSSKTVKRGK